MSELSDNAVVSKIVHKKKQKDVDLFDLLLIGPALSDAQSDR